MRKGAREKTRLSSPSCDFRVKGRSAAAAWQLSGHVSVVSARVRAMDSGKRLETGVQVPGGVGKRDFRVPTDARPDGTQVARLVRPSGLSPLNSLFFFCYWALFSCKKFYKMNIVSFSFVLDKYYPIMV